jgi:hypothetical protein
LICSNLKTPHDNVFCNERQETLKMVTCVSVKQAISAPSAAGDDPFAPSAQPIMMPMPWRQFELRSVDRRGQRHGFIGRLTPAERMWR